MDKQCANQQKNYTNQCNSCSRKPTGLAAEHENVYYLGDLSMEVNSDSYANPNVPNKKCDKYTESKIN